MNGEQKIEPQHLARTAIVYLRQSSPEQVKHNRESQNLQYTSAARARALGLHQAEVIDSDLGRSASAGARAREGFERLLARVALKVLYDPVDAGRDRQTRYLLRISQNGATRAGQVLRIVRQSSSPAWPPSGSPLRFGLLGKGSENQVVRCGKSSSARRHHFTKEGSGHPVIAQNVIRPITANIQVAIRTEG